MPWAFDSVRAPPYPALATPSENSPLTALPPTCRSQRELSRSRGGGEGVLIDPPRFEEEAEIVSHLLRLFLVMNFSSSSEVRYYYIGFVFLSTVRFFKSGLVNDCICWICYIGFLLQGNNLGIICIWTCQRDPVFVCVEVKGQKGTLVFLEISTALSNRYNKESCFVVISGKKTLRSHLMTNHVLQNPYKQSSFLFARNPRPFLDAPAS